MIDVDALLSPIPGESPSGDDIRLDPGDLTIQRIGELRTDVDPIDDPGGVGQTANWPATVRECEAVLKDRTKDLEIVGWLIQGLLHTEGYAGMAEGLRLVRQLLEEQWDSVHPGIEDGEVFLPVRARPLSWIGSSQEFKAAVKAVSLRERPDAPPLTWRHYEESELVDGARAADQARYSQLVELGLIGGQEWRSLIDRTPPDELRAHIAALSDCYEHMAKLEEFCDERFAAADEEPPLFSPTKQLLEEIREYLESRLPDEAGDFASDADADAAGEATLRGEAPDAQSGGPIRTRAAALSQLADVAEFLKRTEPHSPVAYLVQRAVKWGHMPLEALLKDVVRDESVLTQIWETLGLDASDDETDTDSDED